MHLSEINIYPVKSLKGISLNEAIIEDRGLRNDRRWMLVDDQNKFLTQREFPAMAKISIEVDGNALLAKCGEPAIDIPFDAATNEYRTVRIWKSSVRSEVYPQAVNSWFSEILGVDCRLVAMPEGARREIDPAYAVRRFKDEVSFADGYPFMLIGQASLDDLNSRLAKPVPMNRFRPNFVVAETEPFAEDKWKVIRIGSTVFHVVKSCERCTIPTIDQVTGEKTGKEPLRTLSIYRSVRNNVLFGQNLIAENAGENIKVGDQVKVLERDTQ